MSATTSDLERALNEVSASSAGGAPFLIAYGATFTLTGVLSFFIPTEIAALIAMFQGGVALPSPSGWNAGWGAGACPRTTPCARSRCSWPCPRPWDCGP